MSQIDSKDLLALIESGNQLSFFFDREWKSREEVINFLLQHPGTWTIKKEAGASIRVIKDGHFIVIYTGSGLLKI